MNTIKHKKAIELSLNFIIVIILSIVLFGFGIQFISKLFSQGDNLVDLTEKQLDDKITNVICAGTDRICVAGDRKVIARKQFNFFAIKIFNILESQSFNVVITRPNPSGYRKDRTEITNDKLIWNPKQRSFFIEQNEERNFAIGVQVPSDASPGTYIFDVQIISQDGSQYTRTQKLYVEVPS